MECSNSYLQTTNRVVRRDIISDSECFVYYNKLVSWLSSRNSQSRGSTPNGIGQHRWLRLLWDAAFLIMGIFSHAIQYSHYNYMHGHRTKGTFSTAKREIYQQSCPSAAYIFSFERAEIKPERHGIHSIYRLWNSRSFGIMHVNDKLDVNDKRPRELGGLYPFSSSILLSKGCRVFSLWIWPLRSNKGCCCNVRVFGRVCVPAWIMFSAARQTNKGHFSKDAWDQVRVK